MSVLHQGQPPSYQEAHILAQVQIAPAPAVSDSNTDHQDNRNTPALITVTQAAEVDPSVEEQKQMIYRHPLFPLMAMVFEKCELVSASLDSFVGADYDKDIHSFFEHSAQKNQSFHTDDEDLDNLMVRAVQVLRIHLLELEKVGELCKDFCSRYITCLKTKLHSEHLLRLDDMDSPPLSPSASSPAVADWSGGSSLGSLPSTPVVAPVGGGVVMQPGLAMATISQGQIISGNMVYQMVHTPQGIVAQPIQIQASPLQSAVCTTPVIQGSTPLSQIGVVASPVTSQASTAVPGALSISADDSFDDDDPHGKKRNAKRGVLPKHATQIMKSWLFQHLVHPYPTEDEKRQIASQTNLTLLQVNNWFINARRRILQPMLDSGGGGAGGGGGGLGGGGESKAKKSKPVTRPQQRFWPSSIANITPQLPPHLKAAAAAAASSSSSSSSPPPPPPPISAQAGGVVAVSSSSASSSSSLPSSLTSALLGSQSGAAPTIVSAVVTANGQVVSAGGGGGEGMGGTPLTLAGLPTTTLVLASPSPAASSSSSHSPLTAPMVGATPPIAIVTTSGAVEDSFAAASSNGLVLTFKHSPSGSGD
ncbi:homeobox protein PKNOX2-like [Babylonia areolata]|uniref:homeobox protein PKNOX2-like n=1 Tax=Babylonia areolata TaxID=304850 RepID=UPI003FD275A1